MGVNMSQKSHTLSWKPLPAALVMKADLQLMFKYFIGIYKMGILSHFLCNLI